MSWGTSKQSYHSHYGIDSDQHQQSVLSGWVLKPHKHRRIRRHHFEGLKNCFHISVCYTLRSIVVENMKQRNIQFNCIGQYDSQRTLKKKIFQMNYDDIFFTFIVSCHFHMLNCARDGHVHVINNACIKCTNAIFYTGPVFPKHFQISYFSRSQRHLAHSCLYVVLCRIICIVRTIYQVYDCAICHELESL